VLDKKKKKENVPPRPKWAIGAEVQIQSNVGFDRSPMTLFLFAIRFSPLKMLAMS